MNSIITRSQSSQPTPATSALGTPQLLLLLMALALATFQPATHAAEKHAHLATPKGGRLLEKTDPIAEFVVEKDRTVRLHFYNRQLQPVAVTTQTATVIADTKTGKSTLQLQKQGDSLASTAKLPDGEGYTVVVQFRQTPDAKPLNLRFKLDLHICAECKRAEYGCTCDH